MTRLLLLLLAIASWAQAITLVDKGKSPYTIVISANAQPAVTRAANELQRFIEEMSGAKLPIAVDTAITRGPKILLGASKTLDQLGINLADLGPEAFVLKTRGPNLVITGGGQRGTMYGATAFLERLGCRWFTKDVSRIPKNPTIRFDNLDVTEKPAFEYREPFFTEAFDKDWAARNRTNGNHSQLDDSTGGKLVYYPFVHSFLQLLPPEKYFKDHPEYFSLIDGKRRTERGQLCLTNPEVLRLATAQVEAWIKEHPDATIFSVSQNDWEGWCECDRCRRVELEEGGKHSGPLLRFVNALAEQIEKKYSDKLIDTLAYWYTEDPPLKVRPRKNVRIRLCPIGICTAHSFAACPRSAYFMKNLQAWSSITSQLYIWHYNTNFSHYLLPFPDFDELAADIPLYKKNGVVGLFMQGAYAPGGGGENSELRAYVLARQLWNPEVSVPAVIDEFMQGVYGKAAGPMKAHFDLLHSEVRAGGRHLWIFNVPDYSDNLLVKGRELFAQAEAAAETDAIRRRIQKDRLTLDYLALLRDRTYEVRGDQYSPKDLDALKLNASAWIERARSHGIQSIHEGQELKADETYYAGLKNYRVVTLENAAWRADVAPDLNARVLRLIQKSTGQDVLRRPVPGDGGYPNIGGISLGLYPDQHGRAWDVQWTVERSGPAQVVLKTTTQNLTVRRIYRLAEDGLSTETEVLNTSDAPASVAVQVRADLEPVDIDAAKVSFRNASGAAIEKQLIVPGELPNGRETYAAELRPAGEWRLSAANVVNRFAEAERAVLSWSAKSRPSVTLALWSPERILAPGEKLRLDAHYGR